MKHEKKDTMIILFVEPTDERARVIKWLVQVQAQQTPIVVVLPQDAVFRRPGDLRELQQAIVSGNLQLILVIEGNERLRLWARHQGFTVFSATETCFKALSQWGRPLPSSERGDIDAKPYHKPAVIEQLHTNRDAGSSDVVRSGIDTRGEMYRPLDGTVETLTADRSRKTTGYFAPGVYQHTYLRDTEPLLKFAQHEPDMYQQSISIDRTCAPFSPYVELAPDVFPGGSTSPDAVEQMPLKMKQSFFVVYWYALWRDRLLLLLIGLVVLGAVGGVGLGYIVK